MSENKDRIFLGKEQAIGMIPQGRTVHVFLNPGHSMIIGADWERATVIALLEKAKTIEIGGEQCKAMGHPLVAFDGERYHFIEAILPEGLK